MNRTNRHWILIAGAAFALGGGVAVAEQSVNKAIDSFLPDARGITRFSRPGTITLLSSDGQVIQKLGPATREKIATGEMPPLVEQAFVAAEDRRFYQHNGIDLWGISRALLTNLRKGSVREGASTITQQLARTVFLSQDRTITRKLKEAALATKLERQLSKAQILEQYLNYVYLGSGAYGISDAAWVYFSKTPNQLTLPEAALIAGLPPAPSLYSPLVNPDLALRRRSVVLDRMKQAGFISATEADAANTSPLNLKPAIPKYFNSAAPYFTSWVAKKLPNLINSDQIEMGGLKIQTSLNLDWQKEAKQILFKNNPGNTQGAMVSIEPSTGLVRVMIGGNDFMASQFNRATQALRSPGSTFKLFPYAAAINAGIKPEYKFIDKPSCWNKYCPKNFGNKYLGSVSMANALKNSLNTVAVQILAKVGFDDVINMANQLGIGNERPLGKYYPLAIGAYEQTVLDMTAAYAAVANRGFYMKPTPFEEIRGPNNELLWSRRIDGDMGRRAIDRDVADTMNWMLQRVVSGGTGIAAKLPDRPVSGKTGTSEGARDLWFIGSIPQLTTAVWFGYDNNRETHSGSGEAAWTWKQFMLKIKDNFEVKPFPPKPMMSRTFKGKKASKASKDSDAADKTNDPSKGPPPPRYIAPPGGPPLTDNFEPLPITY
ncbi:MAG: transglycosylase domain-containing protein [Prochlorococcus sp.]